MMNVHVIFADDEYSHGLRPSPMDKMPFLVDKMILGSWELDLAGEEIKPFAIL
jgi:hypothetical protein